MVGFKVRGSPIIQLGKEVKSYINFSGGDSAEMVFLMDKVIRMLYSLFQLFNFFQIVYLMRLENLITLSMLIELHCVSI